MFFPIVFASTRQYNIYVCIIWLTCVCVCVCVCVYVPGGIIPERELAHSRSCVHTAKK